jgi:hypothetical protein
VRHDRRSDEELAEVINDPAASERKKSIAREVLRRRREDERQAWLSRHSWVAVLVTAFTGIAGVAAIIFGKRRASTE